MTVSQTSLDSYLRIMSELGYRQRQVYNAICRLGKATRLELAEFTGLPINSVTPRVKELIKKGMIKEQGIKPNPHTFMNAKVVMPA